MTSITRIRRTLPGLLACLCLLPACRLERRTPTIAADLVLTGGPVWTADPERPWAEAVAIHDGLLAYVGDTAGVKRFIGAGTRVLNLEGKLVLPGFQDTHAHPISGGLELGECNLYEAKTPADVERLISEFTQAHADLTWVRGNGWQLPVFPAANPSKALLDRLIPDRPAFFFAADGHSAWANSRALAAAGITRATPDPAGGRIERDKRTGEPSGTLREAAMNLVVEKMPPYTDAQRLEAARRALAESSRFGITTITDADADEGRLEAYAELSRRGELTARITAALHTDEKTPMAAEVVRLRALRARYDGMDHLAANTVKLYVDGVIESRTAALLAPYLGMGSDTGPLVYEPADLTARVTAFGREGFQIHVHSIGDRAIRLTLDALAAARAANGPHDARPVLSHIELFDPADIPRFRELGAIASFQPYWAQADGYITDLTLPALGPARSRWLYPIRTMVRSGAVVVGGSDWSVSSLNPLDAIEVAMTRRGTDSGKGPAWLPEERADLVPMLQAYTINAAYATRRERVSGSLVPGKQADVIVLDRDLFAIAPEEIHRAKVLLTLLDGQQVWADSAWTQAAGQRRP